MSGGGFFRERLRVAIEFHRSEIERLEKESNPRLVGCDHPSYHLTIKPEIGSEGWDRTTDLTINNRLLYH